MTVARRLATPSSVNAAIKQIADVMRRANYAGALQYVPELSWMLFLRILDEREALESEEADAVGASFTPSLEEPFRWRDWAAPEGLKRVALTWGAMGARAEVDMRTPEELIAIIEERHQEVAAAIAELKALL